MTLHTSRRLLLGAGLTAPFIRTASAQTTLEWVAGSVGGGWYTMAAGLSSLIREENPDLQIRVVPGGGLANPTRINNNQSQMGWGIDAFSASAVQGIEPYSAKHERIRCLGTGYSPTEHHFLRHTGAGPEDMRAILTQRLKMQGMIVSDWKDRFPEAREALLAWYRDGKLKLREDIRTGGLDAFPETLNLLYTGGNNGKLLLEV